MTPHSPLSATDLLMNDQHKNELRALIDAFADCIAKNQQIPAACVKAEINQRIAAIPAPPDHQ